MNRYRVSVGTMSYHYNLGYVYADNPDEAKQKAFREHRRDFPELTSSYCFNAVKEN